MGAGAVTLVEGSCFCISLANGDIRSEYPHGLFVQDTRILSGWTPTLKDQPLEPLAVQTKEPFRALFVARISRRDGYADSSLIVERLGEVGAGIQEQITVRNYSLEPEECVVTLNIQADFADLFEVKEARIPAALGRDPGSRRRPSRHPVRVAGHPKRLGGGGVSDGRKVSHFAG